MNNALTFTLNLENSGFSAPAQASIAQIDAIGAAAARANKNLIQLQSGLLIKKDAAGLAYAAASQLRDGTYILQNQGQILEKNIAKTGNAMNGLKAGAKVLKTVGKDVGLLFAPEAAFQILSLTNLVKNLKTALSETGTVGAKILPLLGPIGVGIAAGLTVKFIIEKATEAETAKADEAFTAGELTSQENKFRTRIAAIIDSLVDLGKLTEERAKELKRDLGRPGGQFRVREELKPLWVFDGRSPDVRGLDDLTREAKNTGSSPLEKKMFDIDKRFESRMRELDKYRATATNADLPKIVAAEKEINAARKREQDEAFKEAEADAIRRQGNPAKIQTTDVERMGFVFRGGTSQDHQKSTAQNTGKLVVEIKGLRSDLKNNNANN